MSSVMFSIYSIFPIWLLYVTNQIHYWKLLIYMYIQTVSYNLYLTNGLSDIQQWFNWTLKKPYSIRNIATSFASVFMRTSRLFSIVVTSSKYGGQLWSQELPYMKFWASFPKIYRFQQAKPIHKLTIQMGLACWNQKI